MSIFTKEEYNKKIKEINKQHNETVTNLTKAYVQANAKYKVGDIVKNTIDKEIGVVIGYHTNRGYFTAPNFYVKVQRMSGKKVMKKTFLWEESLIVLKEVRG